MKYLKYSAVILLICVVSSVSLAFAYPTNPIVFTAEVSNVTKADSPMRTKINNEYQKIRVDNTAGSSDSKFKAEFYVDGQKANLLKDLVIGQTYENRNNNAVMTGDVYVKVWRQNIGLKK